MTTDTRTVNESLPLISLSDYRESVLRTANKDATLPYYVLGLAGEVGELCSTEAPHFRNELGDVLWYLVSLCVALEQRLGYPVLEIVFPGNTLVETVPTRTTPRIDYRSTCVDLLLCATSVCELYKKLDWHKKDIGDLLVQRLHRMRVLLQFMSRQNNTDLVEAAWHNREKLRARYPEGFSYEASARRADEAQ